MKYDCGYWNSINGKSEYIVGVSDDDDKRGKNFIDILKDYVNGEIFTVIDNMFFTDEILDEVNFAIKSYNWKCTKENPYKFRLANEDETNFIKGKHMVDVLVVAIKYNINDDEKGVINHGNEI